ncbi:hypothetical protein IW147_001145 [Coemansia sp. RSA 720]|nr:hypothetical protein IW147_001145 [Coemansia sp. RSA 720]
MSNSNDPSSNPQPGADVANDTTSVFELLAKLVKSQNELVETQKDLAKSQKEQGQHMREFLERQEQRDLQQAQRDQRFQEQLAQRDQRLQEQLAQMGKEFKDALGGLASSVNNLTVQQTTAQDTRATQSGFEQDSGQGMALRFSLDDIDLVGTITRKYRLNMRDEATRVSSSVALGSEPYYQRAIGVLSETIQRELQSREVPCRLRWHDSHNSPMDNTRKPDGVFMENSHDFTNRDWRRVVVAVEIKGNRASAKDAVLRGQILQDFIDMAMDQPRLFAIGLGISRDGDVTVYIATGDGIYAGYVGRLPCESNPANSTDGHDVVRLLIAIATKMDCNYGYVVPQPNKLNGGVDLRKLVPAFGRTANALSAEYDNAHIYIEDMRAFSGRRNYAIGTRSWLFYVQLDYRSGEKQPHYKNRHILKIHWHEVDAREGEVHKQAIEVGAPYIPPLLLAGNISSAQNWEALLMGDAGTSIRDHIIWNDPLQAKLVLDMFVGYSHTLLAANAGDGQCFVLHRDVSAANLLVDDSHQPQVIDWGCGLISPTNQSDRQTGIKAIVGTAPYMSCRVLNKKCKRSVIDDLESLFLVFSHCLCKHYGHPDKKWTSYMWHGVLGFSDLLEKREQWLKDVDSYMSKMCLDDECPQQLRDLATNMFGVLFGKRVGYVSAIADFESDPRCSTFTNKLWANVFRNVAEDLVLPCLERLEQFVKAQHGKDTAVEVLVGEWDDE